MTQLFEFDFKVTLPFVLSVAAIIFTWWKTRDATVSKGFADAKDRMDRHDARIARIEQTLQDAPKREDVHGLQLLLVEMRGQIMQLDERLKPVAGIAERMQDLLIEQGRGR